MSPRALHERFEALTAGLDAYGWRILGAVAAEQVLARGTLGRIVGPPPRVQALDAWLAASVAAGLLVDVGLTRTLSLSSTPAREALFSVHPDLAQLVLRAVAEGHGLRDVALETQSLLAARAVGDLAVALQEGDLPGFLRRFAMPRLPRQTAMLTAGEWLRASVCEPFDACWFERTWGDEAVRVGTRVLRESLDGPARCGGLHAWMTARFARMGDDDAREALASALGQHAILRGDTAVLGDLTPALPRVTALGLRAAARFLDGDMPAAQRLLDEALGPARRGLPACGAVTPILAVLLLARDTEPDTAAAKRLIGAGTSEGQRGAARAFRTLLRYLAEAEAHHRRIAVHQMEASAGAWELLLAALTVHLHTEQQTARASFAQHLVRKAAVWGDAGHAWLSKQALLLAHELSAAHCEQELSRQGIEVTALRCRPRELMLWELVAPKPEWKKALLALDEVSDAFTETACLGRRVAWYLDMSDGSFNRPALQEHRVGDGGWTQGQRVTLAELHERQLGLPPEDLRVLGCSRETADGRRELTPEAHEMLVGHPRVFHGMRPGATVDVVRGSCRVETEEDGGYIRVIVEPEGALVGVHVVPESESRLVVYRVTKAFRRVIEVLPRGVRVPKSQEAEVLRVLGKLAQGIEVRSPQLGAERTTPADATPCLRISPHAGAWLVQAGVRPFGPSGRFFVAGVGRSSVTLHTGGQRLRCERDLDLERARALALVSGCQSLGRDPDEQEEAVRAGEEHTWVLGEEAVLSLLSELREGTAPCELEWPASAALNLRGKVTSKSLHGRLRSQKGWYLATGGVALDDVTEVALSELVRAPALAGGRFLRLPSGDYLEVERRIRRVVAALGQASSDKRDGAGLRIHPGAVAALAELAEPGSGFEVDEGARGWLARVAQLATQSFPVPEGLRAELRGYQVDGYRWLCRLTTLGLGACLADDMGLGKTLQILALLLTRTEEGPALVVAPTSVCDNWALEMRRFAPQLSPVAYFGKDRAAVLAALAGDGRGKVVITSYALLQQDEAELAAVAWGTAVLDEAQFIKNAESLRARAAFRLTAGQRVAATGTPVENHHGDLWSIFHFLNPGLLGAWKQYRREFVRPIERDGSAAQAARLRQIVQPYVLRRLKRDVLPELPPLTEVQHDVHLGSDDAMRYALLRRQIHEKLFTASGKRSSKLEVLAELTRLRRFCCHPRLVFPDADSESAKIQTFLELVSELRENQHRALVFSQYVDFLGLVREQLDERGVTYEYLDGSTPQAERQSCVEAFQKGDASLFLISLKAGGFGLNLTAADYVIHLDPWWNPAVEAQATDRAHRIGQERRVTVYRLITKGTIEEKIVELHGKKRRLARALLDGGEQAGELGVDELVRLIEGEGERA